MFEPLNKGHAISEATFFFEFDNVPATALKLMLDAYEYVADILPRNDPMPGMMIEQSTMGFSMNQIPGAEWKHFKSDGELDWLVRINPNSVSVHCLEYSRWKEVWPKAYGILSRVFNACDEQFLPLINVGLRYVDRFDFKGSIEKYDANELFRSGNPYIASQVLTHGPRWHHYTGWFEHSDKLQSDILQQLNIDAIEQMGTGLPIVSITHASLLRSQIPGELDKYRRFAHIDGSPIGILMEIAHDNNRKLLQEVLTDYMLKNIGLSLGASDADS